jgi:hypothetical protein
MTGIAMDITTRTRGFSHSPRLTLEESLDRYARRRDPARPGAFLRRQFGLSADQAREVLRKRGSKAVIGQIAAHPNGGWGVLVELYEPVIGRSFRTWAAEQRERALDAFEAAGELDIGPELPMRRRA